MGVMWPKMRQYADDLSDDLKRICEQCESPIEIRLAAGMLSHNWGSAEKPIPMRMAQSSQHFTVSPDKALMMPQCNFFGRRIDFAVRLQRLQMPVFVALEADGAAYHDKRKDAARDAELRAKGMETIRFEGRRIKSDAHQCAADLDHKTRTIEALQ